MKSFWQTHDEHFFFLFTFHIWTQVNICTNRLNFIYKEIVVERKKKIYWKANSEQKKKHPKESLKVWDLHRCRWIRISSNISNLATNTANKDTAVTALYYLLFSCSKTKAIKKKHSKRKSTHFSRGWRERERYRKKKWTHCTEWICLSHCSCSCSWFLYRSFAFVFCYSFFFPTF